MSKFELEKNENKNKDKKAKLQIFINLNVNPVILRNIKNVDEVSLQWDGTVRQGIGYDNIQYNLK